MAFDYNDPYLNEEEDLLLPAITAGELPDEDSWNWRDYLDTAQTGLAVAGATPGWGLPADLLDAGISAARAGGALFGSGDSFVGELANAGLSLWGAVPIAGQASVPLRLARRPGTLKKLAKLNPFDKPEGLAAVAKEFDAAKNLELGHRWDVFNDMPINELRKQLAPKLGSKVWKMKKKDMMAHVKLPKGTKPLDYAASRALDLDSPAHFGGRSLLGKHLLGASEGPLKRIPLIGKSAARAAGDMGRSRIMGRRLWDTDLNELAKGYGRGKMPVKRALARGGRIVADATEGGSLLFYQGRGGDVEYSPGGEVSPADDASSSYANTTLSGDTGILNATSTTGDQSRLLNAHHKRLVSSNTDAPDEQLNVQGAPKRLYEQARIQKNAIVTHHPTKAGEYLVVDRTSHAQMPQLTKSEKKQLREENKQSAKEARIAANPERYRRAFERRARREMHKDARAAFKRGDYISGHMLLNNTSDPMDPRVLLAAGMFGGGNQAANRMRYLQNQGFAIHPAARRAARMGLGFRGGRGGFGVDRQAYLKYVMDYQKKQEEPRKLNPEEQMVFDNSLSGGSYSKTRASLMNELQLAANQKDKAEIAKIRRRLRMLHAQAAQFSKQYAELDLLGKPGSLMDKYLPGEARMIPGLKKGDAGLSVSDDIASNEVESFTPIEAVNTLLNPGEGRSSEMIKLVREISGNKKLANRIKATAAAKIPISPEMKPFIDRLGTEGGKLAWAIETAAGTDRELKHHLYSAFGFSA